MKESDAFVEVRIRERLAHARNRHPDWEGKGLNWAMGALLDEIDELDKAISHEGEKRAVDEALDVIAVAFRIVRREYE